MAIKKTLYEVLQVSRTASGEVIASAYEARLRALGDSAAPEVIAEKGILRDAHAILSDAVRRKLYDEKLREEAIRAMASGTDVAPRAPASATLAAEAASSSSPQPSQPDHTRIFERPRLPAPAGWTGSGPRACRRCWA